MFSILVNELTRKENAINWVSNIRNLLQRTGFYDVWFNAVDTKVFIPPLNIYIRAQYMYNS